MNARRKRILRRNQRRERMLANPPLLAFCRRCGKPFSPEWRDGKYFFGWTRCCVKCSNLNMIAALGLEDLFK